MRIPQQSIRTFVLRQGRMSPSQKNRIERSLIFTDLLSSTPEHVKKLVLPQLPKHLEIGFGMGDQLIHRCQLHPEDQFLGIDVHLPGIASCLNKAHIHNIENLQLLRMDVIEFLKKFQGSEYFHTIWILFPDPWPKAKHKKRRLLTSEGLNLIISCLEKNGEIFIKTDWENYAQEITKYLKNTPLLSLSKSQLTHHDSHIATKYAQKALNAGREIFSFYLKKQ